MKGIKNLENDRTTLLNVSFEPKRCEIMSAEFSYAADLNCSENLKSVLRRLPGHFFVDYPVKRECECGYFKVVRSVQFVCFWTIIFCIARLATSRCVLRHLVVAFQLGKRLDKQALTNKRHGRLAPSNA